MATRKSTGPHGRDVFVQPHEGGGWEAKKTGAARASAVTETKAEAVARARELARTENSELVVKGKDNKIQSKDSHGHDPKSSKG